MPVSCSYDLNVSATKYFYALEGGEVPLLFLFSGTIFYASEGGYLQVQQIPWDKECTYRMPVQVWQALMDHHYPGSAWLSLSRNIFDKLYAYRRRHGLATWDQAIEQLLPAVRRRRLRREQGTGEQIVNAVLYEGYILYPYRHQRKRTTSALPSDGYILKLIVRRRRG